MVSRRTRRAAAATLAVLATTVVAIAVGSSWERGSAARPSSASPSPTPAPVYVRVGGVPALLPDRVITDPTLLPYPFMSPTPASEPTSIDGTYLRTLTLEELGGARRALPFRCLRCPPYRITPGVNTLVLFHGAYYLHHQLSGFRTMGSFVVEGDRLTLFNDANCPQTQGVYEIEVTAHGIRFRAIDDECSFGNERALDLEYRPWTRVPACIRRIADLWPAAVAC
jgi:hypothetical protein